MIARTLESTASVATHWSVRKLASTVHPNRAPAGRNWQAFGLRRHRQDTSEPPTKPLFIDKVRDIVALDLSQPTRAVVLCNDAKSQIQTLDRTQPKLQRSFGVAERRSHDFELHGTTTLFADLNLAAGRFAGEWNKHRRATKLLKFLRAIEQCAPAEQESHLFMSNYETHKAPPVRGWSSRYPRIHLNGTPTSCSWLNLVECWLALLTQRKILCGIHRNTAQLERGTRDYLSIDSPSLAPFVWHKNIHQKMESVGRFCTRTADPRH